METDTSSTQGPRDTEFRVGRYSARSTLSETFVGPEFRIALSWHDPETGVINDVATFQRDVLDACAALQLALLRHSTASMSDWLLANARWEPPGSLAEALRRVIDYVWTEAERDYLRRDSDARAGHIFESVRLLAQFATKR